MKVSFGIENVHYAAIGSSGEYGVPTALPGAVSLSINGGSRELTLNSYFGDVPFKKEKGSYSGSLIIASLPLAFLSDIYGIELDVNGVEIDKGNETVKPFALLYQTNTDEGTIREVWYSCTAERPQYSIRTNDTGITVATRQIEIKMEKNIAREIYGFNDPFRARVKSGDEEYDTFFDEVYGG